MVKKHSDSLYQAAKTVRQDPGYISLAVETRLLLDELLRTLDKAEKDLASVDSDSDAPEEEQRQA
ncbi:TPA: hypothetical protein MXU26_001549 [Pseudomonas aeruginosa]|nr:hypothetical protein [Pseudomonas aeruginosa]HCA6405228.1 hypothetical protein [Pseudomonas aeruginosa]HCA6412773.1 hypothetical protein [Pseudomonas aeruginosa]HCA6594611.1 hypothetical protein [Pseudomonas aeruginosa]HCA6672389.1 hypothetical protein [Pseudomonas aeruginosa]